MIGSGLSMNTIAKNTGKSLSTVRYWCKKYNIKSKFLSLKDASKEKIPHLCKLCGDTNPENFYERSKSQCKKCKTKSPLTGSDRVKNWRHNTKQKLFEGFGSKCSYCEIVDSPIIYDFHHLVSTEKKFQLCKQIRSWKSLMDEAKKCTMLCSHCHRKLHSGLIELKNTIPFDETKVISHKSP